VSFLEFHPPPLDRLYDQRQGVVDRLRKAFGGGLMAILLSRIGEKPLRKAGLIGH